MLMLILTLDGSYLFHACKQLNSYDTCLLYEYYSTAQYLSWDISPMHKSETNHSSFPIS